jgi:UDP-glucose 4-epimerase
MKILITGANGFIGSYLAHFFLNRNEEVVATSRQFHPPTRKLLEKADLVELDVLDTAQLNSFSVDADIIIHTATANDIISKNALKGIELSAIGTRNILDFAVKNAIPKCIIFSTLQVYGSELSGNINEESALHYQNDYGLNHLFGEMYASLYARQDKLQCVSVRPSNVYGPILSGAFNRWSLVPGCFCREAHETATITIRSSGKQMRNFVHLENLSRAIDCILQHFPGSYECYNLASSTTHTMVEVAEKVKSLYEQEYEKPLALQITGTTPAVSNEFAISLRKLEEIGFVEKKDFNLESAIKQIFLYLKSNQ